MVGRNRSQKKAPIFYSLIGTLFGVGEVGMDDDRFHVGHDQ